MSNIVSHGKRMVREDLIKKLLNGDFSVKLKDITNIQSLTDEQINELKAGDIVLKKTGDQKHTYFVTYKEENHGICISYFAAGYSETVSYDYTDGHWVYNSTDIVEEQAKLTAGDNIQINGNTISATDTTYTAGTGIDITGGVISTTGGGTIYQHDINIYGYINATTTFDIRFKIFNTSSVAYTKNTIGNVIKNLAVNKVSAMEANGLIAYSSDTTNNRIAIAVYSDNGESLYLVNAKFTQMTSALNDDLSAISITLNSPDTNVRDDIRQIN